MKIIFLEIFVYMVFIGEYSYFFVILKVNKSDLNQYIMNKSLIIWSFLSFNFQLNLFENLYYF